MNDLHGLLPNSIPFAIELVGGQAQRGGLLWRREIAHGHLQSFLQSLQREQHQPSQHQFHSLL